jgi:hypothetical protein
MDRWITLMNKQAGFGATRDGCDVSLVPQLSLESDPGFDDFSLSIQVPSKGTYTLTIDDRDFACTCRDSPYSYGAVHVEYANPEAPIRLPVAPGDFVRLRLAVEWKTTRGVDKHEVLLSGTFTVPAETHKMGSPGFNVDVPHLATQMYLCALNIGTPEKHRLEITTFHITLLV